MDRQIVQLLQAGATSISNLILKTYKRLSLSDEEVMIVIHLLSFQQEGNHFPTLHQLEERLSMPQVRLIQLLQRLLKDEWLTIDEYVDPDTGLRYERYNLELLYQRLYQCLVGENLLNEELVNREALSEVAATEQRTVNLYSQFEQAFGRPLSPFEIETLHIWVEQDRYPEELIITALREAVSVGKLYIRYIDRILLEWQNQHITSVEEARNYSMRFRRHSSARDSHPSL
ncbi:DnaD domain-containing protein [Brevibacillus fulvus]|uniref:DNA replication protein n=1 Tax=Brevibacillus fulvus TaxID=1125967 RepID=A0A938XW34_9BACL|nr:DnaD domain protein [Brevibacillus fulvus]MBM7588763.1 DNA replication protein [Brevibacillus fulvus]